MWSPKGLTACSGGQGLESQILPLRQHHWQFELTVLSCSQTGCCCESFKCTLPFLSPKTKSGLRHLTGWIWLMNLIVFGGLSLAALGHLSCLSGLEVARVWCKVMNTVMVSQAAVSTQLLQWGRNLKVHEGNITGFSSACQIFWSLPLAKSMTYN